MDAMSIYPYNVATDEDGNDYLVEVSMDSPGTSEEYIEPDDTGDLADEDDAAH